MEKSLRGWNVFAVAVTVGLAWGSAAQPYEAGEVTNGGTLTGNVTLRGPTPEPRAIPMVIYPFGDFCKKISNGEGVVLLREFNVDGAGGFRMRWWRSRASRAGSRSGTAIPNW
jgi:hypothetical protein